MDEHLVSRSFLYGIVMGVALSNSSSVVSLSLGVVIGVIGKDYIDTEKFTEFIKNKFSKETET